MTEPKEQFDFRLTTYTPSTRGRNPSTSVDYTLSWHAYHFID